MMHLPSKIISPHKVLSSLFLVWYLMVLCYCLYKREMVTDKNQFESVEHSGLVQKSVTKTILVWNGVRRKEVRIFGHGDQVFVNQSCPVHRCEIVTSRTERPIESYDAIVVVFHDELITP